MKRKRPSRHRLRIVVTDFPVGGSSAERILWARARGYRGTTDLPAETALQAALHQHRHPLDLISKGCRSCRLERRILGPGAPLRPPSEGWERLLRGADKGAEGRWTDLRIRRSDGRWWVVRLHEPLDKIGIPLRYSVQTFGEGVRGPAERVLSRPLRRVGPQKKR
jgi:hypothetical protein